MQILHTPLIAPQQNQPVRLCSSEDASCIKALDNEIIGGLHDSEK
jgi:hypothetical protein